MINKMMILVIGNLKLLTNLEKFFSQERRKLMAKNLKKNFTPVSRMENLDSEDEDKKIFKEPHNKIK